LPPENKVSVTKSSSNCPPLHHLEASAQHNRP
jgi:hypothetical protein